tara:strand:+ start:434 stop:661 length:228 start_codon:yes stop_codon:yes gene_type:complete
MKSSDEIKKRLLCLNEIDEQRVKQLSSRLTTYKEKAPISREGLKNLQSLQTELQIFIGQYTDRLLHIMQQNHMVD